jgi:hypothetical protein
METSEVHRLGSKGGGGGRRYRPADSFCCGGLLPTRVTGRTAVAFGGVVSGTGCAEPHEVIDTQMS